MRKAIIERSGSLYRDKQECLDHIDWLERNERKVHGIEVVKLTKMCADTDMLKTIWYVTQDNVYELARNFIREQMVGLWNYAEFK